MEDQIKQPECVGLSDEKIQAACRAFNDALYEAEVKIARRVFATICIIIGALSVLLIGFLIYTKIY